jgi:hypothetical protein
VRAAKRSRPYAWCRERWEERTLPARPKSRSAWGIKILRYLGALCILASGGVHLELWRQSYRAIPVIGPLFMLNVVAAAVIGIGLLLKPEGFLALGALLFATATFVGFVASTSIGLFGFTTGWDANAVEAAAVEIGAIVVLLAWWGLSLRKRGAAPLGERAETRSPVELRRSA